MLKSNVIHSFAKGVSGTVRVKVNVYYDVMVGALHVNSRLDKISVHERKTEQVLTCKRNIGDEVLFTESLDYPACHGVFKLKDYTFINRTKTNQMSPGNLPKA